MLALVAAAVERGGLERLSVDVCGVESDHPADAVVERGGLERLSVDLVETDRRALNLLDTAARAACATAEAHGLRFETRIVDGDFCDASTWERRSGRFDVAILNPPYMKLKASDSCRRMVRRRHGVDCPNLHAAFLVVAAASLNDGGQLVAITPRSFANGLYFTGFRRHLTDTASFCRVVLFDRRDRVFRSSSVLQETRRVTAGVYEPADGYDSVAFENHVNVIHRDHAPVHGQVDRVPPASQLCWRCL